MPSNRKFTAAPLPYCRVVRPDVTALMYAVFGLAAA